MRSGWSPCAASGPSATTRTPRRRPARSASSTASATPSPATTPPSRPTARSACSVAGSVCINTGGEKVYPEEVEEVLKEHPTVRDAVVVGVPDDRFGEVICAWVEPAGDEIDEDALIAHAKSRLAGYKAPRRVLIDVVHRPQPGGQGRLRAAQARGGRRGTGSVLSRIGSSTDGRVVGTRSCERAVARPSLPMGPVLDVARRARARRHLLVDRRHARQGDELVPAQVDEGGRPARLLRGALPHRRGRQHLLLPADTRAGGRLGRAHARRLHDERQGVVAAHRPPHVPPVALARSAERGAPRAARPAHAVREAPVGRRASTRRGTASATRSCPLHSAGKLGAVLLQWPRWFGPKDAHRAEILDAQRQAARLPALHRVPTSAAGSSPTSASPRSSSSKSTTCRSSASTSRRDSSRRCRPSWRRHPTSPSSASTAATPRPGRPGRERRRALPLPLPGARAARVGAEAAELAGSAREVHVLMNNCWRDDAVVNAAELRTCCDVD